MEQYIIVTSDIYSHRPPKSPFAAHRAARVSTRVLHTGLVTFCCGKKASLYYFVLTIYIVSLFCVIFCHDLPKGSKKIRKHHFQILNVKFSNIVKLIKVFYVNWCFYKNLILQMENMFYVKIIEL